MQAVSSAAVGADRGSETVSYIGRRRSVYVGPQAFLIRRPEAGARINPHFHDVDQFQVVVEGDGTLGKRSVTPISFHYADAYTPYGPIVAKENGISFFTLRLMPAGGFFAMPGSRDQMRVRAGRNLAGRLAFDDGAVERENGVLVQQFLERTADGMQAAGIRLAAGRQTRSVPSDGGGQYIVVGSGSLVLEGEELPKLSLLYVEPNEEAPVLAAGPRGAEVLVLQFPQPTARPGSDPAELAQRTVPYHRTDIVG